MKRLFGHDVHPSPKQLFQFDREGKERYRAMVLLPVHQEIDVAAGPRFAPTHGSEDPDILRSVSLRESEDLIPVRKKDVLDAEPLAAEVQGGKNRR